jgi:SAM-dependent methyltransferase
MSANRHERIGQETEAARAYFERRAGVFDRLYSEKDQNWFMRQLNRRFRSDIVRRYLMTLRYAEAIGARCVLDVGCGSGRYLTALAELGVERLVGIDLSAAMLELARKQLATVPSVDIELVCADFMRWSTEERFDLVVAMGFFDYQSEPASVLAKMRALASDSVMASFPSRHWFRTPFRQVRYRFKHCPVFFYNREDIVLLSRAAGFSRVEIAAIPGAGMNYVATFWV